MLYSEPAVILTAEAGLTCAVTGLGRLKVRNACWVADRWRCGRR
jgi:hypothetical protein